MTDKEILEEVYRRIIVIAKNGDANVPSQVRFKEFRDFVEREWQKRDDHPLTKSDEGQMYNITAGDETLRSADGSETERLEGLVTCASCGFMFKMTAEELK